MLLGSVGLLIASANGDDTVPGTNPVCWKEPRLYHPRGTYGTNLEASANRALHLARVTARLAPPFTISPNGAYAFRLSEDPNPGPPSGSTRVSLLVFKERRYLLSVRADQVFSLQEPRWVNEKFIFFRLWLGRLGGVDVLLDVEHEKILHMEAVADGRLLWEQARESCKAVPHVPACNEACVNLE
jgi:hypothetical protein